jgi:biopolymer transport protein ExbD/PHD/YefM family antitoxin component YafN of YafNO toxin-antitoxin module
MRRSRESGAKIDSFPFLSIMVGMIVLLILFMMLIAVSRTMDVRAATAEVAVVAPQQSGSRTSNKPPLGQAGNGQGDLTDEEYQQLRVQIDELLPQIAQRKRDLEKLVELRAELESLLLAKEDELNLAINDESSGVGGYQLGKPDPTIMVPDADPQHRVSKRPRFVEVNADEFIVHRDKQTTHHPLAELEQRTSGFVKFLHEMDKKRQGEYLLVLVHPNGSAVYMKLRKYLLENLNETLRQQISPTTVRIITKSRIDIGVEPFAPEWLLVNEQSPKSK